MKAKNNPYALDDYKTRHDKKKNLNKAESIYAGLAVSYLAVLLFVVIDFACLNSSWTAVQNDNQYLVMLISLGCACVLDIPMAIGAIVVKETVQKLRRKKEGITIVCLCIACFFTVFSFYVGFRMVTRDTTFASNAATIQNSLSTIKTVNKDADDSKVLYAGLFSAVLPFCTSIASFVISYFGCDPLGLKIKRLDNAIIQTDSNIIELKQALAETCDLEEHMMFLVASERDAFNAFKNEAQAEALLRKQTVRTVIMKKLHTPAEVAVIQQSGESTNQNTPESILPDNSERYLKNAI